MMFIMVEREVTHRIEESNNQYTYLDAKWDYQTKTYTATLPETVNGQKSMLGQTMTMAS